MIRVLHVASFDGNIGDIANHNGLYENLRQVFYDELSIKKLEIRRFYRNWNELRFDDEFACMANKYDVLVIGGGAYFKLEWEDSYTGTTIDISKEVLGQIHVPIIFNGMGCYETERTNGVIIEKFSEFVQYCSTCSNILLTVRNDGSYETIARLCGEDIANCFDKVPDAGFFVSVPDYEHFEFNEGERFIAVNIASDHAYVKSENVIKELANIYDTILENNNIRMVFMPHICADLKSISQVTGYMNDRLIRERVSCAPYLNGNVTNGLYVFDIYKKASLALGMRFHSNVCPIGLNTPSIGYGSNVALCGMYSDIGLKDRYIDLQRNSIDTLLTEVNNALNAPEKFYRQNEKAYEYLSRQREKQIKAYKTLVL